MASFEKMAKILLEETSKTAASLATVAQDTPLLRTVVTNQEISIAQNKKIIELLHQLNTTLTEKE